MKISYNWLKSYFSIKNPELIAELTPEKVAFLLTDGGLEVESVEPFETLKGGLKGIVIGEVKTKEKHPDADRLSVTTVDIGSGTYQIVCGAPNVEAGQKVVVATVGAMLYPSTGEPFEIKKSKIRGQASEGMICAEDEIGLGSSHAGIMVLDPSVKVGTPASEYFKVESDFVFEIGLTPNRADAASHTGVARDLVALINCRYAKDSNELVASFELPTVPAIEDAIGQTAIDVKVEDTENCLRYSAITISGVVVKDSPDWLQNKLKAIGVKCINNVVDVTNYVLHELGQPLHAFDADAIKGSKVLVKKLAAGTKFKTLDGVERELKGEELMICNATEGMCIAGVFGGIHSGVSASTKSIFLESACFLPASVRKTAKLHGLKTDASFRFERGTDPNITVYALKRAVELILQTAGGTMASQVIDIYPTKLDPFKVGFSYKNCDQLAGKEIPRTVIKNILTTLGIEIVSEGADALLLSVPRYKVDVQREVDVIEEVLRIYGYNNIELPQSLHASLAFSPSPDPEKIQNTIAELLSNNGFSEILTNSLTKSSYYSDDADIVKLQNALSADLGVLRKTLLYSGLEVISYNQNRKQADQMLYEFGNTYHVAPVVAENGNTKKLPFREEKQLSLFLTGRRQSEAWNATNGNVDFYTIKAFVNRLFDRLGVIATVSEAVGDQLAYGLTYTSKGNKVLATVGLLKRNLLKKFDIKSDVFYASINWGEVLRLLKSNTIQYKEVTKFPEVRRDLALLVNKAVNYAELEQLAYQTEKKLLKAVNLFDVYEGDKLEAGKKSYALSFILQDEQATLTDEQVDKVMEKLLKTFTEKAGAVLR